MQATEWFHKRTNYCKYTAVFVTQDACLEPHPWPSMAHCPQCVHKQKSIVTMWDKIVS